jgi:hypothetical protein
MRTKRKSLASMTAIAGTRDALANAPGWLKSHMALVALVLFTAGWSLMWASGLRLITLLPPAAGPVLMLTALVVLGLSHRQRC